MAAVAKNPQFAKKVGMKQSVGEHFLSADKGKKFREGGMTPEQQKEYYAKNKAEASKKEKAKDYEVFGSRGDAARKGMEEGRMDAMGNAYKKGGKVMKEEHSEKGEMKQDIAQDKKLIKKAFAMHDKQEHKGGKGTSLAKLCKGGKPMKSYAAGGKVRGCGIASKGLTKGKMV